MKSPLTTSMKDGEIERLVAMFEVAGETDGEGGEFWTARKLQKLLEYSDYRNFLNIVEKAKTACSNSGQSAGDHFVDITDMIEAGKGAAREIEDIRLSRYACYLITQNGDSRKKPVAFGQTYFAIQTRRQELSDRSSGDAAVPKSEDEKRVFLRSQIREHNRHLSSAAKEAGVVTPKDFSIFHSKGYQGLYGKTVPEIRAYKGLSASTDILDRMGSTELAANFFRVTQTEEKLRKDKIRGVTKAWATHYAVGRQVREAMLQISGIAPENLPPADNIGLAEKRIKSQPGDLLAALTLDAPVAPLEQQPINLRADLWKYALLIMATKPDGYVSTSGLIADLPLYIQVPDDSRSSLLGRRDNKFSQLVRNLKSHKGNKTNLIYQGLAEEYEDGLRITDRGREFVKQYFS